MPKALQKRKHCGPIVAPDGDQVITLMDCNPNFNYSSDSSNGNIAGYSPPKWWKPRKCAILPKPKKIYRRRRAPSKKRPKKKKIKRVRNVKTQTVEYKVTINKATVAIYTQDQSTATDPETDTHETNNPEISDSVMSIPDIIEEVIEPPAENPAVIPPEVLRVDLGLLTVIAVRNNPIRFPFVIVIPCVLILFRYLAGRTH